MSRPLLALVAIVKNEAHTISRTLDSVREIVDHWTVLDTGSTDDTVKVLVSARGNNDLVGHGPFVDYSQARNLAMQTERERSDSARYQLSLSADETLHGGEELCAFLEKYEGEETAFLVDVRTPTGVFPYPRVLATDGPWRYEGEIQEEPKDPNDLKREPTVKIEGVWIEYAPTDSFRFTQRLVERDVPLLAKRLIKQGRTAKDRARDAILLAQTHEQIAVSFAKQKALWIQEECLALSLYMLVATDETAPADSRDHALFKFLNVAEQLGLYTDAEFIASFRLPGLAQRNPENPAVVFMLAAHTAAVDAQRGLRAAYKAAEVAEACVEDPEHPHDPYGLLWKTRLLAAQCAKRLKHGPAMKKAAEAGLKAGGPPEVFKEFL